MERPLIKISWFISSKILRDQSSFFNLFVPLVSRTFSITFSSAPTNWRDAWQDSSSTAYAMATSTRTKPTASSLFTKNASQATPTSSNPCWNNPRPSSYPRFILDRNSRTDSQGWPSETENRRVPLSILLFFNLSKWSFFKSCLSYRMGL